MSIEITNEKAMQSYLSNFFKQKKWYYYKLPDTWFSYKPYDAFLATPSWDYHIEQKVLPKDWADIFKSLRPQQRGNLDLLSKLNRNALVIVWYKKEQYIKVYKYTDLNNWTLFEEYNF